jgi:hypothetical protein
MPINSRRQAGTQRVRNPANEWNGEHEESPASQRSDAIRASCARKLKQQVATTNSCWQEPESKPQTGKNPRPLYGTASPSPPHPEPDKRRTYDAESPLFPKDCVQRVRRYQPANDGVENSRSEKSNSQIEEKKSAKPRSTNHDAATLHPHCVILGDNAL